MRDVKFQLEDLTEKWDALSQNKYYGTVALVDLSQSTKFKQLYPQQIWLVRLSQFLDTIRQIAMGTLKKPYIKYLGDGALIFSKKKDNEPVNFIKFAEKFANRISTLNNNLDLYKSKPLSIKFTITLDYGSDIYLFHGGDPQGLTVDRAFRIEDYLIPNMIGVSSSFFEYFINSKHKKKFTYAGKVILKGVSNKWQEIYALNSIKGFSTRLSPEQKKKEALINIWKFGERTDPIWIVSGPIDDENNHDIVHKALVPYGDFNAIIEIIKTLSKLYPERPVEIVTSIEYLKRNDRRLDRDIISIGGPYYNKISKKLINKHQLPIYFECDPKKLNKFSDPILEFYNMKDITIKYYINRKKSKIISDSFIFVKLNSQHANCSHFLISGNRMGGTYAAACMFGISSPCLQKNCEILKERLDDFTHNNNDYVGFGILSKVEVSGNYVEAVEIENCKDEEISFFKLPVDYKFNRKRQSSPP